MKKSVLQIVALLVLSASFQNLLAKPELLFRMHGSNTVGAQLAPEMVKAWLQSQAYQDVRSFRLEKEEQIITAVSPAGNDVAVEIQAHGSSTGFRDLIAGKIDVAMASRQIKDKEVNVIAKQYGNIKTKHNEIVIGMDGIAVIVHRTNPLHKLSRATVRDIFSGKITNWKQVGYKDREIVVFARDSNSGTFDTFRSLILGKKHKLKKHIKRFESNKILSENVSSNPFSIGFVGIPYVLKNKALAIKDGELSIGPSQLSVATEDYAISRRLYLYLKPGSTNKHATAFIDFTIASKGQNVVSKTGFISQNIDLFPQTPSKLAPEEYSNFVKNAKRLSLNIRFDHGSAKLDRKAQRDMDRIAEFMQQPQNKGAKILLFGFADSNEAVPLYSIGLSLQRVDSVADALIKNGIRVTRSRGYGSALAVADNGTEMGRYKNRRVEVWINQ